MLTTFAIIGIIAWLAGTVRVMQDAFIVLDGKFPKKETQIAYGMVLVGMGMLVFAGMGVTAVLNG